MNYSNNNNNNATRPSKYNRTVLMNGDTVVGFININKELFGGKELTVEQVQNVIGNCEIQKQETQVVEQLTDLLKSA